MWFLIIQLYTLSDPYIREMQTVNPYFEIGFANGMYMYTFSAREGPPVEYLS